jgi:hypothetical protein
MIVMQLIVNPLYQLNGKGVVCTMQFYWKRVPRR